MSSYKTKKRVQKALIYIILIIAAILTIVPLYWLLSSTFKTGSEAMGYPPTLFPKHPTLQNFSELVLGSSFNFDSYGHSLIIGIGSMLLSLAVSTLSAYGLSRFRVPGRKLLSPLFSTRIFFSIWRTITSICLSLISTPCRRYTR